MLGACLEINQSEISNNDGKSDDLHKLGMAYDEVGAMFKSMPIASGRLMPDNIPVSVLRDSGCSTCVVRSDLVKPEQMTDKVNSVVLIDGTVRQFPVARVRVDSPYLSSEVEVLCMPNSLSEVVIGNIEGAREPGNPNLDWKPKEDNQNDLESTQDIKIDEVELVEEGLAVQTRAQVERSKENLKPLKVIGSVPEVTPQQLTVAQKDDDSIRHLWEKVKSEDKSSKYIFVTDKGWLCRQLRDVDDPSKGSGPKALVVPSKYRDQIMKVAHEPLLQGHLGVKNTLTKIQSQFYWPGIVDSVYRFCKSCDLCQKTIDKGRVPRAPLGRMPLIVVPFQRVAIDLVGPLSPPSERGHRYFLTLIDYATRYPEAIPLKSITTPEVAEALVTVYSRVGIPCEVLSDLGTQFVSNLMKEVSRLLSIKQLTSTRFHPICNGLVEKYNGLIKKILRKMCAEQPKQWDRYLPALLFALREIPNSSLGYSPFELLYGHNVRGPMSILRELWTNQSVEAEARSEYQYVVDLRERLSETWELAQKSLSETAQKYKRYYDVKSKPRKLKIGQKVLILLPSEHNKLLIQWKGPFEVVDVKRENDYLIDVNGSKRLFHINLLKQYFDREQPESHLAGCFDSVECQDIVGCLEADNRGSETDTICETGIVHMPTTVQKKNMCV